LPTYEYQCNACKAVYELRQGFDAETTHKCEECGKGTAKRVLHAPPVVFKGGGWYATDSRNAKSAVSDSDSSTSPSGDDSSKSSDAAKSSTKKETAAKTESKASTTESAAGA
jgi:putative FmdB family regulatory protein